MSGAGEGAVRAGIAMTLGEDDLVVWGRRIGREIRPPVFIGLRGPLGAGKSVLARAVARGAGVRETLPSPTFNIVFRYEVAAEGARGGRAGARGVEASADSSGATAVVHADLYRLRAVEELAGVGWDDIVGDEGAIVLVEWPDRAGGELPPDRWEVTLGYSGAGSDRRTVEVECFGDPAPLPTFPMGVR